MILFCFNCQHTCAVGDAADFECSDCGSRRVEDVCELCDELISECHCGDDDWDDYWDGDWDGD